MFTEQQIIAAHANVKSGANYPRYIEELKGMGVVSYDFFVENGRSIFYGDEGYSIVKLSPKYEDLQVASLSSKEQLWHNIAIHQQGQTDFPAFCRQAAEAGVEKWTGDLQKMLVIYWDKAGREMLAEPIPVADYTV